RWASPDVDCYHDLPHVGPDHRTPSVFPDLHEVIGRRVAAVLGIPYGTEIVARAPDPGGHDLPVRSGDHRSHSDDPDAGRALSAAGVARDGYRNDHGVPGHGSFRFR